MLTKKVPATPKSICWEIQKKMIDPNMRSIYNQFSWISSYFSSVMIGAVTVPAMFMYTTMDLLIRSD